MHRPTPKPIDRAERGRQSTTTPSGPARHNTASHATGTRRADPRPEPASTRDLNARPDPPTHTNRIARRRWPRRLALLVVLMLATLALLPTILLRTPLRNALARQFLTPVGLELQLDDVQGGWWTNLSVHGLTLRSIAGSQPSNLVVIDHVESDRNIWLLLTQPKHLGRMRLVRPAVQFQRSAEGSNWHNVIQLALRPRPADQAPATYDLIEVVEGSAHIVDSISGQQADVDQLHARLEPGVDTPLPKFSLEASVAAQGQAGTLQAQSSFDAAANPEITAHLTGLPLETLPPLLDLSPDTLSQLGGQLDVDGAVRLDPAATEVQSASVALRAQQMTVASPRWLGADRLDADQMMMNLRVDRRPGEGLAISELKLESPWMTVEGSGQLAPAPTAPSASAASPTASWTPTNLELSGEVQLAELARALPNTLRIREGTAWSSGRLAFQAQAQRGDAGWKADVMTRASDVSASNASQSFRWDGPAELQARVSGRDQRQWTVEQLLIDVAFAQLEAQGAAASGQVRGQCDLAALDRQLSPYFQLPWTRLDGQLRWDASWQSDGSSIRWSTQGETRDLLVVTDGDRQLQEPSGHWQATGSVVAPSAPASDWQLVELSGKVNLGDDAVEITATGPAHWQQGDWQLPLQVNLNGQLARWSQRIRPWIPHDAPEVDGEVRGVARWVATPRGLTGDEVELHVRPAEVRWPGFTLREPRAIVKTVFHYDAQQGRWTSPETSLLTTSLSIVGQELSYSLASTAATLPQGRFTVHGQLDRLNQTLDNRLAASGLPTTGTVVGRFTSQPVGDTMELRGDVRFDWQSILSAIPTTARQWIDLRGSASSPLVVRVQDAPPDASSAPGWAERTDVQLATGWEQGQLMGLPMGPGEVQLRWARHQLEVAPLDLALETGKARIAGRLSTQPPYWFEVPAGPLLTNVQLRPEVCHTWLHYLAPLAGNVTAAEGEMSIELGQLRLPLADPRQGAIAGIAQIHNARLGPSPLTQQLLQVAQQIKTLARGGATAGQILDPSANWVLMPQQQIEFAMRDGLVYHRGARFVLADSIELITSGHVGLDDSLSLQAELPVTRSWLRDEQALRLLEGQRLVIPISGSIQRPVLDMRGLAQLGARGAAQATEDYLRREVDQQLRKLLPDVPLPLGLPGQR